MKSEKPVVHYDRSKDNYIETGQTAFVWPIDHPSPLVSNLKFVRTSEVLFKKGPDFETVNTIYKGVPPDEQ